MNPIRRSVAITFLIAMCAGYAVAEKDLAEEFEWTQPLDGVVERGQVYRAPLGGKVFEACYDFPADLRVLGRNGKQLPFFVWTSSEKEQIEDVEIEELNRARFEGPPEYWRHDLQVTARPDGARSRHNCVEIRTGGQDFIRRVEIYGSAGQNDWALLGKGFLISMRRPSQVRNETISYPVSDFPYVQIRVYPNAREGLEEFALQNIQLQFRHLQEGTFKDIPWQEMAVPEKERLEEARLLMFDTGFRKTPVEEVVFDVADGEYARAVRIYGRNEQDNEWKQCGRGEIHLLDDSEKREIDISGCKNRFLKIEVYHYDDQPLAIDGVAARANPRWMVFEATTINRPMLYFGAEFMDPPHYDLRRRVDEKDIGSLALAMPGAPVENPRFNPPGFGRAGPWLAGVAIALISIVLIRVIAGMMKQQAPS
ncbi:DUF3999 family protein [candidate division KSB3 bacterium]|uniref:DUF3999 family protein n=1 Tax=candidate division KSB3 bacterium TaxID=2044937 RepID=A0A9D5JYC0_9BACT|nr:DUF3999 family protein [candidate division KSB3 bacterium]